MKHQKYHDMKIGKILGTVLNVDIYILDAHKADGKQTATFGIAGGPNLV
jgi:hypothetical protein